MTDITVEPVGRGAFTSVGKDNGASFYEWIKGKPLDGSAPEKGFNYEAVNLGVKSIENRLVDLGYDGIKVDGIFGKAVGERVKAFQADNGITTSGSVGYRTGPALFKGHIESTGKSYKWPAKYVYGVMMQESGGDPGAVGYINSPDRGLFQFNTSLGSVTVEQAHDFEVATDLMYLRCDRSFIKYGGKGMDLRVKCTIAQHNNPGAADEWFANGLPPNTTIAQYVSKVLSFAESF